MAPRRGLGRNGTLVAWRDRAARARSLAACPAGTPAERRRQPAAGALHARQPRGDRGHRRRRLLRAALGGDRRGRARHARAGAGRGPAGRGGRPERRRPARRPGGARASSTTSSTARSLGDSVVRVKLWSKDGTILYSDEPALIGKRFALGEEERELFETGGADAELSDLTEPENRYERQQGKLLEAHTPIRTPDGTQVLFEIYQRFGSVSASAERLLRRARAAAARRPARAAAVPGAAGVVAGAAAAARPRASASGCWRARSRPPTQERRRIAADLHDGVVQDLAGVAFGLAPLADDARRRGDEQRGARRCATPIDTLRQGVRDLRTLLVEIHPPQPRVGRAWRSALERPAQPAARPRASTTELQVDDGAAPGGERRARLPRRARGAAQRAGARASRRRVRVDGHATRPATTRLVVADDGRGFDAGRARAPRASEGHVGLDAARGPRRARPAARSPCAPRPARARRSSWRCRRDDPRPARRRPRRDPRRPRAADRRRSTTSSSSASAADGAEAVEQCRELDARRRADGPRHAACSTASRRRGGSSPSARRRRCSC